MQTITRESKDFKSIFPGEELKSMEYIWKRESENKHLILLFSFSIFKVEFSVEVEKEYFLEILSEF
jgi:hypothetical protein